MDSFEQFWNLYDNKKSRDKCEKKWYRLSAEDQVRIMETLPKYVESTPDRQYRKHPATYLNQRCWEDEIYNEPEIENKVLYKPSPGFKSNSEDYKPKEFDRALFIQRAREVLKNNYETGQPIQDWGDVYTTFLTRHCGMEVPEFIRTKIGQEVFKEMHQPRRNRFEPEVKINYDSELRDRCLVWWLENQKEKGIKVYELI